uniref:Uncharacterized protein n=1 Tax=viral metagenome TaxID=1070528 RepID=A0A6M3X672_9ZZZZ
MTCNKLKCNLGYDEQYYNEPYMTNSEYYTLQETEEDTTSNFIDRMLGPIIGTLAIYYLFIRKK